LKLVKYKYREHKNEEILGCFVSEADDVNSLRRGRTSTVLKGPQTNFDFFFFFVGIKILQILPVLEFFLDINFRG